MKLLRSSTNIRVVGEYGQLKYDSTKERKNRLLINDSLYTTGFEGKYFFPLKTTPKAKMTDLMGTALAINPIQLIVSKKMLELFTRYNAQPYEVGKVDINHGKKETMYYLLGRTYRLQEEIINLNKSNTSILDWETGELTPMNFTSFDDFKKTEGATLVNITFNERMLTGYHHFVCPIINMMFISDELARDIAEAKITGVNLLEFDYSSDISQQGLYQLPVFYAG